MKRFVTYLYAYKDGQKMKNTGYIRVDVRGHILDMQVNIKETDLNNEKGEFYIFVKCDEVSRIPLCEILLKDGQYNERILCNYKEHAEWNFEYQDIIGVGVCYENGAYMASCWRDGEEDSIAEYEKLSNNVIVEESHGTDTKDKELDVRDGTEENVENIDEEMIAASVDKRYEEKTDYRKINLNELYVLPSCYWHFSNNSFLLHGFWNYGYLVLKESVAKNDKRIALGIPGVFEQPEMVMATCFGFPKFEILPSQAVEIEIGSCYTCNQEMKNQQPEAGTFGCWFVDL